MSTKLEVIEMGGFTLIKYHISLNRTAIMTIDGDNATLEVKDYGPNKLPLMEVEEIPAPPDQSTGE